MKKILMLALLGCIALNSNVFSMERKQEKEQNSKVQFTKMDWAKLTAASLGCAWLSLAGVETIWVNSADRDLDSIILAPYYSLVIPIYFSFLGLGCQDDNPTKYTCLGSAIFTSGIFSSLLGRYVYKKLVQLRASRSSAEKHKV